MELHASKRSCWDTASPVDEAAEERSSNFSREPEPRLLFRALPMPHLKAQQTEDTQKGILLGNSFYIVMTSNKRNIYISRYGLGAPIRYHHDHDNHLLCRCPHSHPFYLCWLPFRPPSGDPSNVDMPMLAS